MKTEFIAPVSSGAFVHLDANEEQNAMKIYEVHDAGASELQEYFPTKSSAIARAKSYGDGMTVTEHEIGNLTKAVACRLASREGFSKSMHEIYKS
jgi:hypothetical protein